MSSSIPENDLEIRGEEPRDEAAVRLLNEEAFGSAEEADIVDALRASGKVTLSLVAELEGRVVGHILFSPVTIETPTRTVAAVGLAPMAVLPELQRRGIGSLLVRQGLEQCRRADHERMVVLGHPDYYPRFGFVPASRFGIRSEFGVPDDVFMALELRPGTFAGVSGTARYEEEFGEA